MLFFILFYLMHGIKMSYQKKAAIFKNPLKDLSRQLEESILDISR